VHADGGEEDGEEDTAADGEFHDLSDQIQASLSLGGIDPGSNENVKVIGPDDRGDQLGKGDISSAPDVSLTGTSEPSMKSKTAFSSLATSLLNEKAVHPVERVDTSESYVAADDESELKVPGYLHGGKVPWQSFPPVGHHTWFDVPRRFFGL
jgi:calcium/calmodulin-dependent protein kinase I